MTTFNRPTEKPAAGLWLAILGSQLLLALSFVRLWGDANSAIFRTYTIDAALEQPLWGSALSLHIAAFVAALMLAHAALAVGAWSLARLSRRAWPDSPTSLRVWTLLWFALLVVWVFIANAAWFPSSSLGNPYAEAVTADWHGVTLFRALSVGIGAFLICVLVKAAMTTLRSPRRWEKWAASAVASVAATALLGSFGVSRSSRAHVNRERPHVILIGLDSLRPDALHEADGTDLTPRINEFLDQSTVFSDTLTPLARTFPAWVSIVSGRHPHTTGAIINLLTRDLIQEGDTLPRMLGSTGYRTVYATDEVRFSNLDETYGFERVVAPPMGSADFLLGFFSDTPLSNLLVNTEFGKQLFPYGYANRAVAVTYDPDTFIERLDAELTFDEPTFLAVHFTLAHWPYKWAASPADGFGTNTPSVPELYRKATIRLDRQFGDLTDLLRAKGALENAIVVVLSDHGESLGEPSLLASDVHAQRHIPALNAPQGHGTNVFAAPQYQVLLAMRSFDAANLRTVAGERLAVPASLEDIAPTLSEALGVAPRQPFDGVSWLPLLAGSASENRADRIRFLETEFVPPGFDPNVLMTASAVQGAAGYYRVDSETDRVLIRAERLGDVLENRQYAATRAGRLLAAVPSDDKTHQHVVYIEDPRAAAAWLEAEPAPGDPSFDLWTALQTRFDAVRERPIIPPLGEAE